MKKDSYFDERDKRNIETATIIREELPQFCNEFFVGIQSRTTPLTRLNYAYDLRIFFLFLSKIKYKGKIEMSEITLFDLQKLVAFDIELYLEYLSNYTIDNVERHCHNTSKERKLSSLRSFFSYYFKKDKLTSNITQKVDMPKSADKDIVRLEPNEVVDMLNSVENENERTPREKSYWEKTKLRDVAIITLLLGTGIRVSECVGLNVEDLDFSSNSFTITRKGGKQSILYFSDEVATPLKLYCKYIENLRLSDKDFFEKTKDSSALFFSLQGKRICTRAIENLVKKYAKIAVPLKNISPHKLRSTYGTALYRETQDIYVVADILGHRDVNTTKKHYAAMSEDIRKESASKVKLRKE